MNAEQYIAGINKALRRLSEGGYDEVLKMGGELIDKIPDRRGAYLLVAQAYVVLNKLDKAEASLRKGLEKCDDDLIRSNLGVVLFMKKKYSLALEMLDSVKYENAKSEKYFFYKAKTHSALGDDHAAIKHYAKCILIKKNHYGALSNLSNIHVRFNKLQLALKYAKKVVRYYPDDGLAYSNLGSVYQKLGDFNAAEKSFSKSIELDSKLSVGYYNLAILKGSKEEEVSHALDIISKGLEVGDDSYRNGLRFHQIIYRQQVLDWDHYREDIKGLNEIIDSYLESPSTDFYINPYLLSHSAINPDVYRKIAEKYASKIKTDPISMSTHYDHRLSKGKIKIGYYSPNFKVHPGGVLVRSFFGYHDEARFETHAFSLVHSDDFISRDIKESVDYFHDVSALSSKDIADLINRLGIDILVALAGYNRQMKFDVLSFRPAPIQMVLFGSHETTGADFVDYVFSDEYINNKDVRKSFTESVITLPCSLMLNSKLPKNESIKTARLDHHLPSDQFIYASFNHPRKVDPETFDAWMQILKQTNGTILWMYDGGSSEVREAIIRNTKRSGVDVRRIIFASKVNIQNHWERLRHADLLLDCFIYNAHVTAVEALRMGLPMITKKGLNQNSTIGASVLYYSNLSQLITFTKNDYIHTSIELASDTKSLTKIREKLQLEPNTPLFDTELQVKYLEKAYEIALVKFRKNQSVQDFEVGKTLNLRSLM